MDLQIILFILFILAWIFTAVEFISVFRFMRKKGFVEYYRMPHEVKVIHKRIFLKMVLAGLVFGVFYLSTFRP